MSSISGDEQIFARETAVKVYRSFAGESGDVNPDVSYLTANCDGSLLNLPCYTANGVLAMPQVPNPPDDPQQPYPNPQKPGEPRFLEQVANACRVKHGPSGIIVAVRLIAIGIRQGQRNILDIWEWCNSELAWLTH